MDKSTIGWVALGLGVAVAACGGSDEGGAATTTAANGSGGDGSGANGGTMTTTGAGGAGASSTGGSGGATTTTTTGAAGAGGVVDPGPANVIVDASQTFQTWRSWDATLSGGNWTLSAASKQAFLDDVTGWLGLTGVRIDIQTHQIETTNGTSWTNDNANPNVVNASGFQFPPTLLSNKFVDYVLPIRDAVEAQGDTFSLLASVQGFDPSTAPIQANPAEYAELMQVVLDYMSAQFGLVPNVWDVRNEPNNGAAKISGSDMGALVAAAGPRAAAAGYPQMIFAGASPTSAVVASSYFQDMVGVPGAAPYIGMLTYHCYSVSCTPQNLAAIANQAAQHGVETGVTEWCFGDQHSLYRDLTIANVSSWEKFVLGGPLPPDTQWPPATSGGCGGNQLYHVDPPNDSYSRNPWTYYLRQYMRFIRPGAVRLGATATTPSLEPVAFQNPNGSDAVVVIAAGPTDLVVEGLPAGTYQVSYTLDISSFMTPPTGTDGPITIVSGQKLATSIPAAGVITIAP